jgi:hypothetical protein
VSDKELADAVVAHGVGEYLPVNHSHLDLPAREWWHLDGVYTPTAEQFVRDWRVAGALMEKVRGDFYGIWALAIIAPDGDQDCPKWCICDGLTNYVASNESLPRAITEASVKALKVMT